MTGTPPANTPANEDLPADAEQMPEALRKSEERFRRIFEHSNDAVFVIEPERDTIVDVNSKVCRLLGYSRDDLLRMPISAIHPDEMPKFLAFTRAVLERGSAWTDELTCLTRAGEKLPSEISAAVFELSGRSCVIASVRDITMRKRAEEALQRYSENLQQLVEERTDQLRHSEERHRALLEVNNAIVANLDRQSLFDAIARALQKVLPFDRASITLLDRARDVMQVFALTGVSDAKPFAPVGTEFPRRGSHLAPVFDNKRPHIRSDLATEPHVGAEDGLFKEGIRSYVSVPLMAKQEPFGTLNVGSRVPRRYSGAEAEFLAEVGQQVVLAVENMLAYEEIAALKARLEQENIYLQEEIKIQHNFEEIVGQSRAIKKVLKAIETVAPADSTVLIAGETGTGKELVARAIHNTSSRKDKPLVKVNCGALPAGLIESELFGHEKGAFTGALSRKTGRFELAGGGTIFLDEIGALPADLQAKLLRVLQEGEFERLGGSQTLKVDVRVIAATNRDLDTAMREGTFRSDLYYRLNVFPIQLPALRERTEDISLLVRYFVMKFGKKLGKRLETIPQRTLENLLAYPWPGNVRELENVIERAVLVSEGSELELGEWLRKPQVAPAGSTIPTLEELERRHILEVLERTRWRVSGEWGAAKILGIKPTTLEARMKKLGITRKEASRPKMS